MQGYGHAEQKRCDPDIKKMIQKFDGRFIDPLTLQILQHILQILQQVLLRPVQLLGALEKGNEMVKRFMKERYKKVERQEKPQKCFYDPLPKANVKTMADMQKTVIVKTKSVAMNGE